MALRAFIWPLLFSFLCFFSAYGADDSYYYEQDGDEECSIEEEVCTEEDSYIEDNYEPSGDITYIDEAVTQSNNSQDDYDPSNDVTYIDEEIRCCIRERDCTYGRCCHQYPNVCQHEQCSWRYWCQAHCVYLGPYDVLDGDCATAFSCGRYGVWLPEDGLLFKPFVADPRQVTYSVGWRFHDQALTSNVIPVSFGDNLGIYRWCCVGPWGGMLQINIEGALWGVFDPLDESSPLLNADYYVGIPISYAIGRWGFRVRAYHISSHIGDEFLIFNPGFDRRNPSAEYLDGFISYYITDEIRIYSGLGWIIQHDDSFNAGKWYAEAGAEVRLLGLGFYDECENLFGHPFFGMHFHFNNHYERHVDNTYVLGYECGKACGNQRRVRAFLEYHDGYSVDGQFRKYPTNYLSVRFSYGY